MKPAVNYEKEKRRAVTGIVASAIVLALASSMVLAAWFFFLDAASHAMAAQKKEQWFDPWEESGGIQEAYKCWEIIGLSEEFAADFKETYHYYFAFDTEWYPLIVKMKGELGEEFGPYMDVVYKDDAAEPEPMLLRGVASPIEDDIREFAIECLNVLYDEEFVTEENFEEYMGVNILDTTAKPMGRADFGAAWGLGGFGIVMVAVGAFLLSVNIKRRTKLETAAQRARESMRQAAAWQNMGYEQERYRGDGGFGETETGGSASGYSAGTGESSSGYFEGSRGANEFGYVGSGEQGYTDGSGIKLVPVKKSNMFLGILGALGGSFVGVGIWVLISIAGFIAGFAGLVMLKCALWGYGKLSGRLDKKGAVISLVMAAFMVFFANCLDYVIALCRSFFQWDASFDTVRYVIMNFGELMTETESWGGFYMNLVLGYGLSIWASYKVILGILNYQEGESL